MDEINFDEHHPEIYDKFSECMEYFDLSIENSCILLVSQSNKKNINPELLESFVNSIIKKRNDINITNYIDVWLCLAKINTSLKESQRKDLIHVLTQTLYKSKVFKIQDLLPFEIVNIIVSCSLLRLDDKMFI